MKRYKLNNLRGNLKGLTMAKNNLSGVNRLTLLIRSQANPQRSEEDLFIDALYVFISRMICDGK